MPANTTPIFPGTIRSSLSQITNSDGTNLKSIFTAGANGSRIDAIWVYSTSASTKTVQLYMSDGTTNYLFGSVSVGANSGIELLQSIIGSVLSQTDALYVQANYVLKVALTVALSTGEVVNVLVLGGDY